MRSPRFESGLRTPSQARPVLEERIRQRVAALPNVRFAWRAAAVDLGFTSEGDRVNGVWARLPDQGMVRLEAELVVDASGVGSRLPRWLQSRGYEAPPEERDPIDLVYTSGLFRRRSRGASDWRMFLAPPANRRARGGLAIEIDPVYVQVSLYGYGGLAAPAELEGFADYAAELPGAAGREMSALLGDAVLVSELERFAIPHQVRRRYERLRRVPAGLLAIGDALTRFDPAPAQGISVAALQADALGAVLAGRKRRRDPVFSAAICAEFFARAGMVSMLVEVMASSRPSAP